MKNALVFLFLAVIVNEAVCMTFRHKRQSPNDDENDLDDRYGWDRPGRRPRPTNGQGWPRPDNGNTWPTPNGNTWPTPNSNTWPTPNSNTWPTPNTGNTWPQPPTTANPSPNGSSTQSPQVAACIRACPVTAEYNPVCGSDGVTYNNPGSLLCATQCGVNVTLLRASRCPATTTAAPS